MQNSKIIKKHFYTRSTLKVAQDLLGCFLVRKIGKKIIHGRITEVEAYIGEDDLACHASKGRTPRTEIMYGHAGYAYVYMIYGMYNCLNVVTEKKDFPAAVLIRSIQIEGVEHKKTNGPGKLCRFLKIDRKLNNLDMTVGEGLWIEMGNKIDFKSIKKSKRIGVDYALHCKHYLWRFTLNESHTTADAGGAG
jgi:DNA-3-methyladenine glycosylase